MWRTSRSFLGNRSSHCVHPICFFGSSFAVNFCFLSFRMNGNFFMFNFNKLWNSAYPNECICGARESRNERDACHIYRIGIFLCEDRGELGTENEISKTVLNYNRKEQEPHDCSAWLNILFLRNQLTAYTNEYLCDEPNHVLLRFVFRIHRIWTVFAFPRHLI